MLVRTICRIVWFVNVVGGANPPRPPPGAAGAGPVAAVGGGGPPDPSAGGAAAAGVAAGAWGAAGAGPWPRGAPCCTGRATRAVAHVATHCSRRLCPRAGAAVRTAIARTRTRLVSCMRISMWGVAPPGAKSRRSVCAQAENS